MKTEMANWLEALMEHEVAYFDFVANVEKTATGWFLTGPELPDYWDANHALHLRDDGRGPEAVAREVLAYYRARGTSPVADVDEVAEAQGIGAALRRLGVTPVIGDTVLMRYVGSEPPAFEAKGVTVETVPNETGVGEATAWIATVEQGFGEGGEEWKQVVAREARYPACRLYLAQMDGQDAGACDLFEADGWARIESVGTRPEFRRRGVASAVVARAVADSLAAGNTLTYLFTEAGGGGEQIYRKLGFVPWKLNPLRRHLAR